MVRIKSLETLQVQLPTRREHKWTGLTEPIGGYVLVRMVGEDSTVGWGEGPALKDWGGDYGRYYGEGPGTTIHVIERYLKPVVEGLEAANIVELHRRMDAIIKGFPYAKAAVEMAAFDLAARSLEVPVWVLLGGRARLRVPITHSIGLMGADEAVEECRCVVAEGIRTIKIKVGVEPERDVALVERVRTAVGDDVDLCVDANNGYRSPGEAVQILRRMEPFRLKYVEQPCQGISRVAKVAARLDAPVMLDEGVWNKHDVIEIAEQRAGDIVSIYTTKPGGLQPALEVAATASAAGLLCNVNGSMETGVGNLANLQLAAAAAPVTLSCVIPISTPAEANRGQIRGVYYTDDLLRDAFAYEDGFVNVPDAPGMGIEVDEDKIARYRVAPAH